MSTSQITAPKIINRAQSVSFVPSKKVSLNEESHSEPPFGNSIYFGENGIVIPDGVPYVVSPDNTESIENPKSTENTECTYFGSCHPTSNFCSESELPKQSLKLVPKLIDIRKILGEETAKEIKVPKAPLRVVGFGHDKQKFTIMNIPIKLEDLNKYDWSENIEAHMIIKEYEQNTQQK